MTTRSVLTEERPPVGVASEVAALARALQAQHSLQATLQTVCELAVHLVNADDAAITTVRDGRFRTVAATGELPHAVDQIQYDTGEGPCVDSIREHETFATGDLAAESRWPSFADRATVQTGVHSMLSHRLFVREGTLGALNVYALRKHAFTDADMAFAKVFATHAAIAYQAAHEHDRAENLEVALNSNRRIGMAVGILMTRDRITEEEAFARLRETSQNTNTKLLAIAEQVVYTGALPQL